MAGPKTAHGLTFFEDFNIFLACALISKIEITQQGPNFRVEIQMSNGISFTSQNFATLPEATAIANKVLELTNNIFPYPYPE